MKNEKMERNLSMLTDLYQLTMGNGYLKNKKENTEATFDMFFRRVPDKGAYAIAAGLEQLIEYIKNLSFSKEDIEYLRHRNKQIEEKLNKVVENIKDEKAKEKLRSKSLFSEEFLQYLENFKFVCDVWAAPEGTPVFPSVPIVKVKGPIIQAQLIETMVLLTINHPTLIATKASRIVRAAQGKSVFEFGSRRSHGYDAAIFGARAAYIGGCTGTACTIVEEKFGIPSIGTMAHSWVQSFDSEYEAFKAYAETYPTECVLLVDTYNVLESGIPNAIRVAKEILEPLGCRLKGVRLDSGDLTYLTIKSREMLDAAGLQDCSITVSNSLDEEVIQSLLSQGAKIDSFGVGERLITAKSEPVFGGVYKLVSVTEDGVTKPKIKISENIEKVTNPCNKEVYRVYDNKTGKAIADLLTLEDEIIDPTKSYTLFDPEHVWKRKRIEDFTIRKLLVPIFEKGECVYKSPSIHEIQKYSKRELDTLWNEHKRLKNPQTYIVDLSQKLWDVKHKLLMSKTTF